MAHTASREASVSEETTASATPLSPQSAAESTIEKAAALVELLVEEQGHTRAELAEGVCTLTADQVNTITFLGDTYARQGVEKPVVLQRVAQEVGCSVATVLYHIRRFDEKHPDKAIFPRNGEWTPALKRRLFQDYRRGQAVEALANRYDCTAAEVSSLVAAERYTGLQTAKIDYIANKLFAEAYADPQKTKEAEILAPLPASRKPTRKPQIPTGLPNYLARLYEQPLLTREQEGHLFRQYNYLKFCAARLRSDLDSEHPEQRDMDKVGTLLQRALQVKNALVQANLRLVVSVAKKQTSDITFFEHVSEGNLTLLDAVEKFDYARGNKFSTYLSWALMRKFNRAIPNEFKKRARFQGGELLEEQPGAPVDRSVEQRAVHRNHLLELLPQLDKRERFIVNRRYLNTVQNEYTFEELGKVLGISKERVRQLEMRGIHKLKKAAEAQPWAQEEMPVDEGKQQALLYRNAYMKNRATKNVVQMLEVNPEYHAVCKALSSLGGAASFPEIILQSEVNMVKDVRKCVDAMERKGFLVQAEGWYFISRDLYDHFRLSNELPVGTSERVGMYLARFRKRS